MMQVGSLTGSEPSPGFTEGAGSRPRVRIQVLFLSEWGASSRALGINAQPYKASTVLPLCPPPPPSHTLNYALSAPATLAVSEHPIVAIDRPPQGLYSVLLLEWKLFPLYLVNLRVLFPQRLLPCPLRQRYISLLHIITKAPWTSLSQNFTWSHSASLLHWLLDE